MGYISVQRLTIPRIVTNLPTLSTLTPGSKTPSTRPVHLSCLVHVERRPVSVAGNTTSSVRDGPSLQGPFLNFGHCWIRNIQDSPNFGRNHSQSSSRESTRQKNHELPLFQIMYLHGRPVEEPVDNQRNRETKVDKQQSSWKVSVDISG
ncbi:uncharacterized protein LOC119769714 [Culex quinquefasciatus]|uniref:uncharacterized protein LOC119769714 n=1 Tax=Culex quinquefasciatus TaxID=7176 RepID=UPI0018E29872|nr:uncharacterized protein LOC119769714 [Culex quinquefasciatus]